MYACARVRVRVCDWLLTLCQRDTKRLLDATIQGDEVLRRMTRVNNQLDKQDEADAFCLSCLHANPQLQQRSQGAAGSAAAKGSKSGKKK